MEVDHDIDVVSARQPQFLKHACESTHILPAHQGLRVGDEDNLERSIATRHHLMGKIDERLRIESLVDRLHIPAAQVGIHTDPVADLAAEESIDGNAKRLAEDIPARLFQAADCAHANHTHTEKRMAVKLLVDVLDITGILPDEHRGEIFDRTNDGAGLPLKRGFAPAEQARLVGDDFDEDPIPHLRVDDHRSYVRDFHKGL